MSGVTSSGGFRRWARGFGLALFFLFGTGTYQADAQSGGGFASGPTAVQPPAGGNRNGARYRDGGFSFTGPAEFYADGRMTCHRAKAVMRFRLGYSDLVVHGCAGRRYHIEGRRGAVRELVTLDAFTTNPVGVRRLR